VLQDRKLHYYKSPENPRPISFIPLDQAVIKPTTIEDVGDEFGFEIVTNYRVFVLAAKSQAEMMEWIKILSQQTLLNKENQLIEQADELISRATYLQAKLEEERENEQFEREEQRRKAAFFGITRTTVLGQTNGSATTPTTPITAPTPTSPTPPTAMSSSGSVNLMPFSYSSSLVSISSQSSLSFPSSSSSSSSSSGSLEEVVSSPSHKQSRSNKFVTDVGSVPATQLAPSSVDSSQPIFASPTPTNGEVGVKTNTPALIET
jgi:hypothetical protein